MTDLRKAAQQALEALEEAKNGSQKTPTESVINALRTALEQQTEPVAWPQLSDNMEYAAQDEFHILPPRMKRLWKRMQELYTTPPQQQAEPVAWMDREGDLYKMPEIKNWAPPHTMLYTAPPQRQWQGLTDEEIGKAWFVADGEHNASAAVKRRITRAIEAKLKERNND